MIQFAHDVARDDLNAVDYVRFARDARAVLSTSTAWADRRQFHRDLASLLIEARGARRPEVLDVLVGCVHHVLRRGDPASGATVWMHDLKGAPIEDVGALPSLGDGHRPPVGKRYHVDELIGNGGMAEVYLAHDVDDLDSRVAIKTPRADQMGYPGLVERFRREGRTAAGLKHPNIVSVLSAGDSDITDLHGGLDRRGDRVPRPYIVMEHVNGVTLRQLVSTGGPVARDQALRIIADVLSALRYIHAQDLIHGDITSTNVMLSAQGEVKLLDFGSSQAFATCDPQMTQGMEITPAYSSPERVQGQASDARADLYSTGCVLYELLTGCTPFVGESPVDVAYQHVHETPQRPSSHFPDIGPGLDAVALRALAKDTSERYQSAEGFRRDLLAS